MQDPWALCVPISLLVRTFPVRVFERNSGLEKDPRAATTHPATLQLLEEVGIREHAERVGLVAPIFQFWDRPSGELVAEFDHSLLGEETDFPYVVQCEQFKLAQILYESLQVLPNANVSFDAEVCGLQMGDEAVAITVQRKDGRETIPGKFVIGADGGRSFVRKALGIAFEGFTWEERFIVLTTTFDFETERGCTYRSYFADPSEWVNCFKVAGDGPPGLWRTVFPADLSVPERATIK